MRLLSEEITEYNLIMKRIGIYAGSFDPVHDGHIGLALAAANKAKLDEVYFLPERSHRLKRGVTHMAHRVAMLKLATEGHAKLKVLELPDRQFSVAKTLPRLNQMFPKDQLLLLIGSDLLVHMVEWPLVDRLFSRMGVVVGLRQNFSMTKASQILRQLPIGSEQTVVIKSPYAAISSAHIRNKLLANKKTKGLNSEVQNYIKANWLYASPSNSSSAS